MKNASTLNSKNTQSPKTPGGISKSLLTPCRRLGLSRNWKKSGPSPFKSPLANSGVEKQATLETRKRKERVVEEEIEKEVEHTVCETSEIIDDNSTNINITPSRIVDIPRRKKSKTLLSNLKGSQEDVSTNPAEICEATSKNNNFESIEVVSTPVRTKSKKTKKVSPKNVNTEVISIDTNNKLKENVNIEQIENNVITKTEKSPNDLKKECIVVIQKKAFKNLVKHQNDIQTDKKGTPTSQTLFDSDSDEVPLIQHKNDKALDEDDDFIDKPNKSTHQTIQSMKSKPKKDKKVVKAVKELTPSQTFDEDDDFEDKKTILIRKTYEKVTKPLKARSTGSITQRDIDELRARIETKKKLLLARSLTPETAELRCLIKKWQKGCQDALMELLVLMKSKFPEQNMDYSEMLNTLKIPASLVGYDSENDCFNTPNDEDIILGHINDL